MTSVNISQIGLNFAPYSYSVEELVDDIFCNKLDSDTRDFAKNELGINRVYKAFDLKKIDFDDNQFLAPDIPLNDMYVEVAKKVLESSKRNPSDIGLLITINDNQQHLDPSPTVELAARLNLGKNIRTQNFQGLACSSLSEAIQNAAGYFSLGNNDDVLVLIGTYYTSWFLDRIKQIPFISKQNKADFNNFIYFLIFSDVTAGVVLSGGSKLNHSLSQIDIDWIYSLKDTRNDGYKKATIKLSPDKKNRIVFEMNLNSKLLKENVANLSSENVLRLRKQFKNFEDIELWGFHTAGAKFVDYIREKCNVKKNTASLSYELMKETGNTGAVSSLQFIKESIDRKILPKDNYGCFVDYGWEGVNTFLYKSLQ